MATGRSNEQNLKCCLESCLQQTPNIVENMPHVEVCTVMPATNPKQIFSIKWSKAGEAVLHEECWKLVLKSARVHKAKNCTLNLTLSEKAMVKEAAKTAERHDGIDFVAGEGKRIAEMIKSSKHCVAFTGAGISTSAGIGDYRGKSGKWTQDDRAAVMIDEPTDEPETKKQKLGIETDTDEDEDDQEGVPYEDLRPTYTHEALQHLMELGYVKYIISQNGDGLHLLSGVPLDQLSELHGNVFLEKCERCHHVYERPYYVMDDMSSQYYEELEDHGKTDIAKPKHAKQCQLCGLSHRTGRKCTQKGCKGFLMDTIINFRDHLEDSILDRATDNAKTSDLMLCLGTTLRVTPACDLVEMGEEPIRLVICNRQGTPLDKLALKLDPSTKQPRGSRVHGDCDLLMNEVMKCILSQKDLRSWEADRVSRMKKYDSQRNKSKS